MLKIQPKLQSKFKVKVGNLIKPCLKMQIIKRLGEVLTSLEWEANVNGVRRRPFLFSLWLSSSWPTSLVFQVNTYLCPLSHAKDMNLGCQGATTQPTADSMPLGVDPISKVMDGGRSHDQESLPRPA